MSVHLKNDTKSSVEVNRLFSLNQTKATFHIIVKKNKKTLSYRFDLPCVWAGLWGRQADPRAACASSYCWTTWREEMRGMSGQTHWEGEMKSSASGIIKTKNKYSHYQLVNTSCVFSPKDYEISHILLCNNHRHDLLPWLPVMPDIFDSILGVS